MENNPYINEVLQTNGCRVWENPNKEFFKPEENSIEIFIKNLPKTFFENDILPHFERFGPIYQFRLLVDYDNGNRGFAYLIFYFDKSALECLDLMSYHLIAPGVMLEVERSQERSHLQALNVPFSVSDNEIKQGFHNLYKEVSRVFVRRNVMNQNNEPSKASCNVILEFLDHKTALNAKRWSGIGSVNLWGRNIKILWAPAEQVEDLLTPSNEVKHVLIHNMPERFDPHEFGILMCDLVSEQEIISIRPMKRDWLVQFASQHAAYSIFSGFNNIFVGDAIIDTEWVTADRLRKISSFADFDFELRCICLANYWDPPIFIYSRIVPFTKTQLCAVIIKNNRTNQFTTFFMEMCYDGLTEIHSRVCEAFVLIFMEIKELPKKNFVIKCSTHCAVVGKFHLNLTYLLLTTISISLVGSIFNLADPKLIPTDFAVQESMCLYREDIYALSRMCHELIATQMLDDIHDEYKLILKQGNIHHQFICGIVSDNKYILGCIDPLYRRGKPLKFMMDSRHMILAMCEAYTKSNASYSNFPSMHVITANEAATGKPPRFKIDMVEFIPLNAVQSKEVHYTYRPFIEFNQVDTFGLLRDCTSTLLMQQVNLQNSALLNANNYKVAPVYVPARYVSQAQEMTNDFPQDLDEELESLKINDFVNGLFNF